MTNERDRSIRLYETRKTTLISFKDGKCMSRAAKYLTPCARNVHKAIRIPDTPLLSEIWDHNLQEWSLNVVFRGWKIPQKDWKGWVDSLEPIYKGIWRNSGIYDSIMCSTYEIRCNNHLVLGLAEFWCPETNTFVFPWGEATITLEDVMVLGGYPVLGEPVTAMPAGDSISMVGELENKRLEFAHTKSKKASFSLWLKKYKGRGGEFEHLAFLSLWLSRFVLPSEKTIGKNVFPIAVLLSQGRQVALAPAVLASLYRDLRLMTERVKVQSGPSIAVVAPFHLLHLWAFERFPVLGPKNLNALKWPGEVRVARWHKLTVSTNLPLVRSALKDRENYKWRPYATDLENWYVFPLRGTDKFYGDCSNLCRELRSFAKCIEASELVGLGFTEKYRPHRVAMQFGLDQDLPATHIDSYVTSGQVGLFVPPKFIEAGVSIEYSKWWESSMYERQRIIQRRRNPSKFVQNRLRSDTPIRQTSLNQTNIAKAYRVPETHRIREGRRDTNSSFSFSKRRMEDSQHYSKNITPSIKNCGTGSSQGGALLKKGGSYERVNMGPYNFTDRLEGRPTPSLIDANVSAKHMKRKADDERYGDSANDGFQDGKMKEQRAKGFFNDRGKNSARRFTKTSDHFGESVKHVKMEADNECSGDSLNYGLQGGNMRDQRVQRPFIDLGKQDLARRFTNDDNSYKDINHKEHQGIGIEKRLQRLEKIVGVDPQIQSSVQS